MFPSHTGGEVGCAFVEAFQDLLRRIRHRLPKFGTVTHDAS